MNMNNTATVDLDEYNKLVIHYDNTVNQGKKLVYDSQRSPNLSMYYTDDAIAKELHGKIEELQKELKEVNKANAYVDSLNREIIRFKERISRFEEVFRSQLNFAKMSIREFIKWRSKQQ